MILHDVVGEAIADLERWQADPREVWGLPTGLQALDRQIGGLHRGEYSILAAGTNVGKSALAGQLIFSVARNFRDERSNEYVYVFSTEMLPKSYLLRELVGTLNIPTNKFRRGEVVDLGPALTAAREIARLPVDITYDPDFTVESMRAHLRQGWRDGRPVGLIVLDYIQSAAANAGDQKRHSVGALSKELADLARSTNVPVLVLAQLNREAAKSGQPALWQLAESADLERSADNVLLLDRPEMHDPDKPQNLPQDARIFVAKVRNNGERGLVQLIFHPAVGRFSDTELVTAFQSLHRNSAELAESTGPELDAAALF